MRVHAGSVLPAEPVTGHTNSPPPLPHAGGLQMASAIARTRAAFCTMRCVFASGALTCRVLALIAQLPCSVGNLSSSSFEKVRGCKQVHITSWLASAAAAWQMY